jgi:hypothetical protein
MVYKVQPFCQFFLSSDTRRLTARWMLYTYTFTVIFMTNSHYQTDILFVLNLVVDFISSTGTCQPDVGLRPGFVVPA